MQQKHSIDFFYFSDHETNIVSVLLERDFATIDDFLWAMYGGVNEPEYPENVARVVLYRLKKKLNKQGYSIETSGYGRNCKAKYRLCVGQNKKKT